MKRAISILLLALLCPLFLCGEGGEVDSGVITLEQGDSLPENRAISLTLKGVVEQSINSDLARAKELFLEAQSVDSLYAPPLFYLSGILSTQNRDSALVYAQKAYLLDSTNRWYTRQYARLSLLQNDSISTQQALYLFGKLIEDDAADVQTYYSMSRAQQQAGKPLAAIETLDSAQVRFGFNPLIWSTQLEIYAQSEDYPALFKHTKSLFEGDKVGEDEKVAIFDSFIADRAFYSAYFVDINSLATTLWQLHPNSQRVLDSYTKHLVAGGMVESVADIYRELIFERGEATYLNLTTLIDVESYLKRPESVEQTVKMAAKLYPDSLNLYPLIGYAYIQAEQRERAIEGFKWGVRQVKDNSNMLSILWSGVGDCYQNLVDGDMSERSRGRLYRKSFAAYQKALEANGDNALTLNNYAYALTQFNPTREDVSKALIMSTRANSLEANNASYLDTQGHILFLIGNYKEAKNLLQQALSLNNSNPEIMLHYAEVLTALGEWFLAEVYFERAEAAGYPQTIIAAKLAELEQLKRAE